MADLSSMGWGVNSLDSIIDQTLVWSGLVGAFLASTFVFTKLAYEYWRYSIGALQGNSPNIIWDWNEVVRVFFIVGLIGLYTPICKSFVSSIKYVNSLTQSDSSVHKQLEKAGNKIYYESRKAELNENLSILNSAKKRHKGDNVVSAAIDGLIFREQVSVLGHMNGTPDGSSNNTLIDQMNARESLADGSYVLGGGLISSGINQIAVLIAGCIKMAVGTVMGVVFKVGLSFGPLVLAFSIFWREKAMNYLNFMLNVGLVFTTINIIDMIVAQFSLDQLNNPSVKESIAFNIAIIGCYWSAFKMTSYFVGATGMSSIMSRGMATATTVVVGAMAVAGTAAGGMGGAGAASAGASGGGSGVLGNVGSSVARGASSSASEAGKSRVD